jgi:hypothetical protein
MMRARIVCAPRRATICGAPSAVSRPLAAAFAMLTTFVTGAGAAAQRSSAAEAPSANTGGRVPGDDLARCAEPVRERLARLGARPAVALDVAFGWEGSSRVLHAASAGPGCTGFFAFGREGVRDLDLVLYDQAGVLLAQDRRADPTPYVRACLSHRTELRLVVTTHEGAGEHGVLRVDAAPAVVSGLSDLVTACTAPQPGGGAPPLDVGPEPAEETLEAALRRDLTAEEPMGRLVAPPVSLDLAEHTSSELRFDVDPDGCHLLLARHGPTVHEVELLASTHHGVPLGGVRSAGGQARLALCAPSEEAGAMHVRIAMRWGSGRVAVALLALPVPLPARAFAGAARARHAEAAWALSARGLQPRPLAWAHLRPGPWLSLPLPVKRGRCVAVTVVWTEARPNGGVRIALVGEDGRLRSIANAPAVTPGGARGASGRDGALAYACAETDETLRVLVSAREGTGRALVWVGEELRP